MIVGQLILPCQVHLTSVCAKILIFPGGRRDPEDVHDRATAERETREEIGLTLTNANSIFCGGLDQRLLRTSGTTIPLMVLCPYGTLFGPRY